jgi:hypothetical protein
VVDVLFVVFSIKAMNFLSQVVPCYVRRQFNNLVGNVCDVVSPDGKEYRFNVKKKRKRTHIFGPGYMEFLSDYDMNEGDKFTLKLDESPERFRILRECTMGFPKHRCGDPGLPIRNTRYAYNSRSHDQYVMNPHIRVDNRVTSSFTVPNNILTIGHMTKHDIATQGKSTSKQRIPGSVDDPCRAYYPTGN